ncbi:MAG: LUD domain-containing protein [Planctomycetaceae bacterium]|jgi:L-lactate dehydrogenase complex protein LldG|nr:LUD domain-containing protein [Planctomycetaceae bacterium]
MAKSDIIQSVRRNRPAFCSAQPEYPPNLPKAEPLPDTERKALFIRMLQSAGGEALELAGNEVDAYLAEHFPIWNGETQRSLSAATPKSELEQTEVAVFEGRVAVAENAAVWIDDRDLPNRLLPFVVQHLILIVREDRLVDDMLEGYRRINLNETGFGVFISGPSKTADIEQSLVYGAHGAVQCTVIIVH